jgi:hypothetical protein
VSIKQLSESTPVTMALATALAVGCLSVGVYLGGLSQRVTHVEVSQTKTADWAADTAAVLARLETLSNEHERRLAAAEQGTK